jgi:GT2 family glycosyltransferase/glycosyltransferase involved in cell wall biosynthesis
MKSIDIVIVNYNSTDDAARAIESIIGTSDGVVPNIVVADNGSSDRHEGLEQRFPQIQLVLNKKNLGFSKAINQALRKCHADYIVIMNPDTFVINGFFAEVLNYLENNKEVGVVGPKIFDADGSVQGSARRFPTPWSYAFGRKSPLTRIFPNNRLTQKEFMCFDCHGTQEIPVDWVSGACMVIRREVFDAVGGFDERFFLYWEDTDLCRRISAAGWRIVYYPEAEIKHLVGVSSSKSPVISICHFHHSCFKLFEKHTRWPMRVFIPVTFMALAVRCLFAIVLHLFNRCVAWDADGLDQAIRNRTRKNSKIKIMRIVSRMNIGGPSIHVSLLTKKMDTGKFETRLVTGALSPHEGSMAYLLHGSSEQVRTIAELQREIHPVKDGVAFLKLFNLIRTEKPDIVHTHTAKAGTIGRLAAFCFRLLSGRKVVLVHTFHGNVLEGYFGQVKSKLFGLFEKCMALFTDAIIAISPTQKWELIQKFKISHPGKIHIINLGFDLSAFLNEDGHKSGVFRDQWALNGNTTLIGIVGRMVPIKNHHMFLDAARLFLENDHPGAVKFVVVGDGERRNDLERYAKKLGIVDRVIFCGWENDISKVYADLDILALTSFNEGTPVSIIEAMAASVPVISTEVGGIKDLVGEPLSDAPGSNGFRICKRGIICKSDDVIAFSKGIRYLIDNGLDKKSPRIQQARDYVLENYSEAALIHNIEKLYDHLLAG